MEIASSFEFWEGVSFYSRTLPMWRLSWFKTLQILDDRSEKPAGSLWRWNYSSEGDRWRKQRWVVQPAFHHDRIMKYSSTMVERMTARADKWRHGERLDILKEMIGFTTDVICEVIFGQEQSADAKAVANSSSGGWIATNCR